jgi:hypothetical protein
MYTSSRRGRSGIATGSLGGPRTTVGPDISEYSVADRVADLSLTIATLTPQVEETIKQLIEEVLIRGQFADNSFQIVAYACALHKEKDARLLDLVLDLIFRRLKEDPEVKVGHCMRLCQIIGTQILPTMQDGRTVGSNGQPATGTRLFRACLLSYCQRTMEQTWQARELAVSLSDQSAEDSEAAQVAVTRWLNLVEFIRATWGSYILGESIVHAAIEKQLAVTRPADREIYKLWAVIEQGTSSQDGKVKDRMHSHYARLRDLATSGTISPALSESILVRCKWILECEMRDSNDGSL